MSNEEIKKSILMVNESKSFLENEKLFPYLKKMYTDGKRNITIKVGASVRNFTLTDSSYNSGHAFSKGHISYTLTEVKSEIL